MKQVALAAMLVAGASLSAMGAAKADLMITPNGGEQDLINDAGGTTGSGDPSHQPSQGNGLPPGLSGYNSQDPGSLAGGNTVDNTTSAPGEGSFLTFAANTDLGLTFDSLTTGAAIGGDADPVDSVSEPSALVLFGGALLGLGIVLRRRRSN
ncbi:MAG TPA: PEP-CTERM sorting domain-containing protein [Stellaceae bacterium]|nr:PEP-CTERM sorting domain-containing protein [Stellaceae bacterium]